MRVTPKKLQHRAKEKAVNRLFTAAISLSSPDNLMKLNPTNEDLRRFHTVSVEIRTGDAQRSKPSA